MNLDKRSWIGAGIAAVMIIASVLFLRGDALMYFVIVIALIIGALPFLVTLLLNQGRQKEKESQFLGFTRDLVENVKSGTPVSRAIINLKNREYGALTPHVQKLASQIVLGIPLTKALITFAQETKSKVIARAVGLISEAERAGGDISSILESVSLSVNQVENLKKERKSSVYNLVVQGYIIFIVFIIIMLVLEFKILPLTVDIADVGGTGLKVGPKSDMSSQDFSTPMFVMILVQSFFSGLVIGKISEGTLKYGIKHSFILLALTLLITTGARAFFG